MDYLVTAIMEVVDEDGNDNVDREEFRDLTKKEILLQQFLGTCLPDADKVIEFRKMLEGKTTYQIMQTYRYERRRMLRYQVLQESENYIQSLYPVTLELE